MREDLGPVLGTATLTVESGKASELARALRAPADVVVPTFTVVAAHSTPPGRSPNELVIDAAGFDQRRVLLGEMRWSYRRPLEVGDELVGSVHHLGSETKHGPQGVLHLARGAVVWRDDKEVEVVIVHVTLIEAPPGAGS